MKVGFLVTNEPWEKQLCGVSSYLRGLLPRLAPLGVETSLFWTEGAGAGGPGVPYRRRIRGWGEYRAIHFPNPELTRALRVWIDREHPDLLHCHWAFAEALALLRDLPPNAPPAIVSCHTYEPVCPRKTHTTRGGALCEALPGRVCLRRGCRSPRKWLMHDVPTRSLARRVGGRAALYLVHNHDLAELVERAGYDPVRTVPLGVELPAEPAPAGPRPPVLLFAGRLRPEKGVAILAEALPRILETVPDAALHVAGEGPLRGLLAAAAPPERIRFLGVAGGEDLARAYRSARALVFPSVWKENFGLVGPEALSHGTPVIASEVGGIREWLRDGENGIAFPWNDARGLARAAIAILQDGDLAVRLSEGARRTAAGLSVERHAEALAGVYRGLLERAA